MIKLFWVFNNLADSHAAVPLCYTANMKSLFSSSLHGIFFPSFVVTLLPLTHEFFALLKPRGPYISGSDDGEAVKSFFGQPWEKKKMGAGDNDVDNNKRGEIGRPE